MISLLHPVMKAGGCGVCVLNYIFVPVSGICLLSEPLSFKKSCLLTRRDPWSSGRTSGVFGVKDSNH